MKVKKLKELLERLEMEYTDSDSWDVLINFENGFAMIKPDAIYEGSAWNIVIDCDYQPEEIVEEITIKPVLNEN
ncbi:hypothetical protein FNJ88_06410 [Chryseobacterium sp. SNU WT5]|uniref:hypothetical protein n=1 Tax=Chryseobacterium sp. SNU WT5 TaxID=2594269 RepID=UPI00117FCDE2|nr:hypothetical protein [Chryseobacterium sp. SNU WT5]QDP85215.1 hypothetical protein FNJ88_06410 [Chryseobacterium sp. SNU WT5]